MSLIMKQTVYITDMAMLLKDFFETYLPKERGVSGHTIRSYSATFQSLYSFFKGSKQEGSTGLGLSLVDGICKLSGLAVSYAFQDDMHCFYIRVKQSPN